ncbi:MAG: hypothetical protein AB1801_18785, partial [Chloroflexota bacterium]
QTPKYYNSPLPWGRGAGGMGRIITELNCESLSKPLGSAAKNLGYTRFVEQVGQSMALMIN